MGKPSDFENVVGRQFSVSFEIVDKSGHAKSSSGENGNSMPYQVCCEYGYVCKHATALLPRVLLDLRRVDCQCTQFACKLHPLRIHSTINLCV